MHKLYHHLLMPQCRKIRVILGEKKIPFSLEAPRLKGSEEMLEKLNPAGTVPILLDKDEKPLADHIAISEYLEEIYPDRALLGSTPIARAETRRLVGWFDEKFDDEVTHKIVFEKIFKRQIGLGQPDPAQIRLGLQNLKHHMVYMNNLLSERHWLAGDQFSLADIAAASHLSCLDYLGDIPWESYPNVHDWYARIKSRPSFRPILQDSLPGIRPADHYDDPDF